MASAGRWTSTACRTRSPGGATPAPVMPPTTSAAIGTALSDNSHRVTSVAARDRTTPVGTWTYAYTSPELNSLGALGGTGLPYMNSAALYLDHQWPAPSGWLDNKPYLAVQE